MISRPHRQHVVLVLVCIALLLALAWVAQIERQSQTVIWDSWWWLDGR